MRLCGPLEPLGERVGQPVWGVNKRQLFCWPAIAKFDSPRFLTEDHALLSEINEDRAVQGLDCVLDEEGHLDVLVLEEFAHLLFN